MPVTYNGYDYEFVDGDLRVPTLVSKPRKSYPIPTDTSVFTLEEEYMQFTDYYQPLKPTSRHPDYGNVYYVGDSPIQDVGNGVGRWSRKWTVLPGMDTSGRKLSYVNTEYESYVYSVPGIDTVQNAFFVYPVSSATISNGKHTITTTAPHDITAGSPAYIRYQLNDPINKFIYYRGQYKIAQNGTAGSTLVVSEIKDINTVTILQVQRADTFQDPYQKVVMSKVDKDYWLPGVNCTSVDDIPIIQEEQIINNENGSRIQYINENTTPTLAEWLGWIDTKRWICVESSTVRLWQGNIYERATRYVRATK